jgi:hypothetical protein
MSDSMKIYSDVHELFICGHIDEAILIDTAQGCKCTQKVV